MRPMINLAPGETARADIHKGLYFDVTHEGWNLKVTCNWPFAVKPNSDGSMQIICTDYAGPDPF